MVIGSHSDCILQQLVVILTASNNLIGSQYDPIQTYTMYNSISRGFDNDDYGTSAASLQINLASAIGLHP